MQCSGMKSGIILNLKTDDLTHSVRRNDPAGGCSTKKLLIPLMMLLGMLSFFVSCSESQPEQVHGMWFRPPDNAGELLESLEKMRDMKINTVFIETYYHSWSIYPGEKSIQRPEFLGWDPLKMTLDFAREHNMEVHAWIEVFYAFNPHYLDGTLGPVLTRHPDWMLKSNNPDDHTAEDGKLFLNPAHPGVQDYLMDMMKELVETYDVDGVHLDYIRYPVHTEVKKFGYGAYSKNRFADDMGYPDTVFLLGNPDVQKDFADWKKLIVTRFVRRVTDELKEVDKDIQLSAAIFPSYATDPQSLQKFQDWASWVKGDMLDFITPMCYAPNPEKRRQEIRESLEISNVPVVVGLAINRVKSSRDVEMLIQDGLTKGSSGIAWFAYNWRTPVFTETVTKRFGREQDED
ncbi:TPA: hypothetical protein DCG86_02360 [Candidatus Marinimicrobia bacterium]|nr:MAG: protein of unknown function DUF187 [Marinimicrobia bacterium 46_47]KUK93715.1 MAG: protein of unknown function DUF187 [Marinimicrobia bacterium 46_43]HAE86848.1 hypothetical protein [Candidatus Neomarinimicrobiota bacterium]HBY19282.1 hypothetical protein [Candidatus Neomarinimicrobiota bacterium]